MARRPKVKEFSKQQRILQPFWTQSIEDNRPLNNNYVSETNRQNLVTACYVTEARFYRRSQGLRNRSKLTTSLL
jgi:hypothetical protein